MMKKFPKKTPKWLTELKEFAMRGNVMDLAVGVMVGASFQAIVKSFVDDIISPIIGLFGGMDFSQYKWVIGTKEVTDATTGAVSVVENTLNYGKFITAIINFLIMVVVIFFIIKVINKITALTHFKKAEEKEEEAPTTKKCPFCCSEIAIEATRCPHCTSVIEESESEE